MAGGRAARRNPAAVLLRIRRAGRYTRPGDRGRSSQGLNGYWRKTFSVTPGAYYRFQALSRTDNMPAARRSAIVEIVWQDETGQSVPTDLGSVEAELPAARGTGADGWTEFPTSIASRNALPAPPSICGCVGRRMLWCGGAMCLSTPQRHLRSGLSGWPPPICARRAA